MNLLRVAALAAAVASCASAANTTVTGTITAPTGDRPSGSCTISAIGMFTSGGGLQVTGSVTVSYTAGAFTASLVPTDSGSPSTQYYNVTCKWPAQTINGRQIPAGTVGPQVWLVPTSGSPVTLASVITPVPPPVFQQIQLAQISASGLVNGLYCWQVVNNFLQWTSQCPGSRDYSINAGAPQVSDSGLWQYRATQSYQITGVACDTDQGSVSINLDVRSDSSPNTPGTVVLASPLPCGATSSTSATLSTPLSVAAGAHVALQILSMAGSPNVARVYVLTQ